MSQTAICSSRVRSKIEATCCPGNDESVAERHRENVQARLVVSGFEGNPISAEASMAAQYSAISTITYAIS
jgi:hypothetical protein